ncbi:unnamed protein product [Gongylonema pulchrum]|uniref:Ferritin n=1 Tax=Gongylonema pulchrum TaxID=637853 RepID=A0A183CYG9_9BILA|nr:unnamed protein product [Gongylonema pulchrum]
MLACKQLLFLWPLLLLLLSNSLAQKRRILRLMTPWANKATDDGQKAFQSIVDNEMQHINTIYKKLGDWANQQGPDFVVCFVFKYC